MRGIRCCMMAPADALIMPMTCGSLPALATKSTPVTPAAPLLFSTTTDWPRRDAMPCARWRPNTSDGPPAGNGITRVIGLLGKAAWACARLRGRALRPARVARRVMDRMFFRGSSRVDESLPRPELDVEPAVPPWRRIAGRGSAKFVPSCGTPFWRTSGAAPKLAYGRFPEEDPRRLGEARRQGIARQAAVVPGLDDAGRHRG